MLIFGGRLVSWARNSLPPDIQGTFPPFKLACVRKVKTELVRNLKIRPITVAPGCKTAAALKKLETEFQNTSGFFFKEE